MAANAPRLIALIARARPPLRWIVAGLFVYAGAMKALDPMAFASAVREYRLLPAPAVPVVALFLPWFEIACGLGVLIGRTRAGALAALTGLGCLFVAVTGSAWLRGLDVQCGCFGAPDGASGAVRLAVVRAALIAVACLWLLRGHVRDLPSA